MPKRCKAVLDSMVADLKGPLFPNIGEGNDTEYNSVDAPLWFFWTLQQYADHTGDKKAVWDTYSRKMKLILDGYQERNRFQYPYAG